MVISRKNSKNKGSASFLQRFIAFFTYWCIEYVDEKPVRARTRVTKNERMAIIKISLNRSITCWKCGESFIRVITERVEIDGYEKPASLYTAFVNDPIVFHARKVLESAVLDRFIVLTTHLTELSVLAFSTWRFFCRVFLYFFPGFFVDFSWFV